MALTTPVIQAQLEASKLVGPFPFNGVTFPSLALAIAQGVSLWAVGNSANLALSGVSAGTAGAGAVAGFKITVPPNNGAIETALRASGVGGQLVPSLAMTVAMGIATAFTLSAQYSGLSTGVGVGTDVSAVSIANPATLTTLLLAQLHAVVGRGQATSSLAAGLGQGIAIMLLGSVGLGTVTGPSSVVGAGGTTFSTVV